MPLFLPGMSLFFTLPPAQRIGYIRLPTHLTPSHPVVCMFKYVADIFILLRLSFTEHKCLILMKSSLSLISFRKYAFGLYLKSYNIIRPKVIGLLLCYFLILWSFSIRSVFHWIIFCYIFQIYFWWLI